MSDSISHIDFKRTHNKLGMKVEEDNLIEYN